jgi:glycylpeptide N-tetradecanoyltransferase
MSQQTPSFWSNIQLPLLNGSESKPQRPPASTVPTSLPEYFEWAVLDLQKDEILKDVCVLLNKHYVESEGFCFQVAPEFLRWAMVGPRFLDGGGYAAIRCKTSGKLVGFVAGTPFRTSYSGKILDGAAMNFLCVHKKLRSKRMMPVLIREITRIGQITRIAPGIYTSGKMLHKPIAECTYHQKVLNCKALIDAGFIEPYLACILDTNVPARTVPGLVAASPSDLQQIHDKLSVFTKKFKYRPLWSLDETLHYLMPRDGIVGTYVVKRGETVTDMASYYVQTIKNTKTGVVIKAAHLYMYFVSETPLKNLASDIMRLSADSGCHMFNVLDVMDNATIIEHLGLSPGSDLYHLISNFDGTPICPNEVAVIIP